MPSAKGRERKTTASTKAVKKPAKKTNTEVRRTWSILLFFYGIFSVFLTFVEGAGLWNSLYKFHRGLFGLSVFWFAPMVIFVAVMIALDKSQSAVITKLVQGTVLLLLFCGLAQILIVGNVEGKTFVLKLKGLYNDGVAMQGGGLLSAVLGWSLLAVFRRTGASIIIILLTILFVLLLSPLTLVDVFRFFTKPFRATANAVSEDKQERLNALDIKRKNKVEKPVVTKESNANKRIDIAKYISDDDYDDEANFPKFSTIDELEHSEELDIVLPQRAFAAKPQPKNTPKSSKVKKEPVLFPIETKTDADIIEEKIHSVTDSVNSDDIVAELNSDDDIYVEHDGQTTFIDKDTAKKAYRLPPIDLLKFTTNKANSDTANMEIAQKSTTLVETLRSFGVQTRVIATHRGPSVTRFELQPAAGVKVSKITGLADDIALNLAAEGVRIEAPIPGKAAVGIELANKNRDSVSIRELIDSDEFRNAKGKLNFAVGKDIEGNIVIGDIAKMPHVLIAGTTGSGKSVFTNSIIMNILYRATPDDVKLMLIDPKQVEFPVYNGIPHLISPVITEPRKAAGALCWAVNEMLRRYKLFADNSVRDLYDFNEMASENNDIEKMPQIVIVIDELADLMMAASKEVEDSICRLAQLARAAGMHLIIATQSPRVDVVTGLIKANFPSRTALKVSNNTDSRIILDEGGAEKLLGNGDLLYKPVGLGKPIRIQGSFVSTSEIRAVVNFLKNQSEAHYDEEVLEGIEKNIPVPKGEKPVSSDGDIANGHSDDMFEEAMRVVVESGQASTSFLQRKLSLGYARAARIMDDLESMGIVGEAQGAKPRQVLMSKEQWLERQATRE